MKPKTLARPATAGFTLIELMVVIFIIGLLAAATLLSVGTTGRDSQLEQERDRLAALIEYVRERAALQTVEYGLRCEQGGFRFVMYDNRKAQWLEDSLDDALRPRTLPAGLDLTLTVEDRAIVLPALSANTPLPKRGSVDDTVTPVDLTPQVMLFSSGDLSRFKLTLARTAAGRSAVLTGTPAGKLEVGAVIEKPR